ncbi:sensor histidine kinase [Embleya sp. NPDC056575]|uniref:sensor histidine kinase n=1 Tax=unclassified Embleya TaxID=2699296 RepID=UPI0036885C36
MPSSALLRRRRSGSRASADHAPDDHAPADSRAGAGPRLRLRLRLRRMRRGLAYLALGLPTGLLALVVLGTFATPVLMACTRPADISSWADAVRRAALLLFGILLTVGIAPLAAAPLAALERRRLRVLASAPATPADPEPADPEPSPRAVRFRARYTTARAWREVAAGYLVAVAGPGLVLLAAIWAVLCPVWLAAPLVVARSSGGPVALGIGHARSVPDALPYCAAGLAAGVLGLVVLTTLVRAQAALSRTLVEPRPDPLAARLVEVTRSRSRLADGFAAERRRIERDLHDGAQQQLLGLTLQLGLARMDLPADSAAGRAVARAHDQAKTLMADLRELIRGIHPQVLTDRGLGAALYELAEFCPLPVGTDIDLPHRPPRAVETAAYFAAAEALANALRHSAADHIRLTARVRHGRLTVDVEDDGRGGARLADGTGLTGLADRVAVVDGTIRVSSPPGGPTLVRVTIPCPPHPQEDDR